MSERVAVVGAGTMGSGIAQVCAASQREVVLLDVAPAALERARTGIEKSLGRLVRKEKLSESEARETVGRIEFAGEYGPVAHCDVVIEAVFEDLQVKAQVWGSLREHLRPDALLATNTSSLSVTQIAGYSGAEERFCGMHFFNPVPVLPLVEVIRALNTSGETIERARTFAESIGKSPIVCEDKPGFIVNRLLIPYVNDAVHALSEGVASAEDIDRAMKLGANMPIGPLALADLVGLDVALAAAESLHEEFGDPKFRVAPLLRQMVRAGKLGRKSGAGFYSYED